MEDINEDFISGLLNFFVWGLGYIYHGKYFLGALWLIAFVLSHMPMFYLGLEFYQKTVEGTALFMGHLTISTILLYLGIRHEARSPKCWKCIEDKWHVFVMGTVIAGLISEYANEFVVDKWWVYHPPWTSFSAFGSTVGIPLVLAWLLMVGVALLFTFLMTRRSTLRFIHAWIVSWVGMGFVIETFNSLVWRTWHYPVETIWRIADLPGLDYGLLVPIVGYGGTGVFTYLGYVVLSKLMEMLSVGWKTG
ncbi:MAG: hypothetical protein AB1529_00875 [Candidatus Micrarchaeota archaeon]